ncbi:hypothetical protein COB64_03515 [Candidatus Wolfebacteria bacterium]|nr:MAG: hypothetical protein COB64_03515 [Candidatus Wolfebacteria bacterium]
MEARILGHDSKTLQKQYKRQMVSTIICISVFLVLGIYIFKFLHGFPEKGEVHWGPVLLIIFGTILLALGALTKGIRRLINSRRTKKEMLMRLKYEKRIQEEEIKYKR